MRHSITRRFKRSPQRQSVVGVAPQKNGRGFNTHANPTDPEVDIIFVHGLDGGSFSSWAKNEDPRLYWPKEWLPKEMELSTARIHTYGYNLDPRRDLNSYWDFAGQFLTDLICSPLWFGTLPIILVGHSTGGLVIKKAYILSAFSQIYNRISCAIQSFIFLSTPHKPLDARSFKKWRKINPCLTSKPAMDSTLAFLTDQFQRVHRNKRILNFVEAKSTSLRRGHKKVVVCSHETSVMGFPQEIVVPLTASHNSISKFKSPNDTNYATFYRHLVSAVREIREARDAPLSAPPAYTPHVAYAPHSTYIPHSPHIPYWAPQTGAVQTHTTGQQRRRYVPAEWR